MSKLLKAVEKAKRNKRLQEEQNWEANGQLHANPAECDGNQMLEDNQDSIINPMQDYDSASDEMACEVPKSFFQDDLVLDELALAKNRILTKLQLCFFYRHLQSSSDTRYCIGQKRKVIMFSW